MRVDVPLRRVGAQPGNQNRYVHGRRSRAYLHQKALSRARLRVLALLAAEAGLISGPCQVRPVGPVQVALLAGGDPELLALAVELNIRGARFFAAELGFEPA